MRSQGCKWRNQGLNPGLCAFSFTPAQLREESETVKAEKLAGVLNHLLGSCLLNLFV